LGEQKTFICSIGEKKLNNLENIHKIKLMKLTSLQDAIAEFDPIERIAFETAKSWFSALESLVSLREQKGLTQKQVGDALGVSQAAIAQFENGSANPTIQRIKLYAMVIGASVSFEIVDSGISHSQLQGHESKEIQMRKKPGPKAASVVPRT
jgi:DNA-binding XRE family transcriptional regulator